MVFQSTPKQEGGLVGFQINLGPRTSKDLPTWGCRSPAVGSNPRDYATTSRASLGGVSHQHYSVVWSEGEPDCN